VIAAAAIIMISVFGSFVLNGDPTIKQFGVGLSVAVLLASAMVLSLAPAMLTLFGGAVWWLPGWQSGRCNTSGQNRTGRTADPTRPAAMLHDSTGQTGPALLLIRRLQVRVLPGAPNLLVSGLKRLRR
jgi:MMPL family